MADGGIQMSQAFIHFTFWAVAERRGPRGPLSDTQSMEDSQMLFFLLLK